MTLSEQIEKDYLAAYKGHQATRVGVLRLLKTAAKNRLVELARPGGSLSDEEMLEVIIRQGKQRQDSIEQYTQAGRPDLAAKEAEELEILKAYMPAPLSADELASAVEQAIAEAGATNARDMGKVMGLLMARYKGRVDGKLLSETVRKKLA